MEQYGFNEDERDDALTIRNFMSDRYNEAEYVRKVHYQRQVKAGFKFDENVHWHYRVFKQFLYTDHVWTLPNLEFLGDELPESGEEWVLSDCDVWIDYILERRRRAGVLWPKCVESDCGKRDEDWMRRESEKTEEYKQGEELVEKLEEL
jgi:hypothetical protein